MDRPLPGDELIAAPTIVMDRVRVLEHPAERVWPWLVQLGKGRAGWYLPPRAELLVPRARRGARRIHAEWQALAPGDRVPDYGPGSAEFEVALIDPPRALVYRSLRGWPGAPSEWPPPRSTLPDRTLEFTWTLTLHPITTSATRVHLRLRGRRGQRPRANPILVAAGGLFDRVTVELMFAGLDARLRAEPGARAAQSSGSSGAVPAGSAKPGSSQA